MTYKAKLAVCLNVVPMARSQGPLSRTAESVFLSYRKAGKTITTKISSILNNGANWVILIAEDSSKRYHFNWSYEVRGKAEQDFITDTHEQWIYTGDVRELSNR